MPTVAAQDFWPVFMQNEAGSAVCRYLAARGGAALGALLGGSLGSALTPAGTAAGATAGSVLGGAGGAALGAALCPDESPTEGEYPLAPPFRGGQCADTYFIDVSQSYTQDASGNTIDDNFPGLVQRTGPISGSYVSQTPTAYQLFLTRPGLPDDLILTQPSAGISGYTASATPGGLVSGAADNCGDVPIDIPGVGTDLPDPTTDPFARNPVVVDIDFGNGNVINADGTLALIGAVFLNGDLNVNFNFDGLNFSFNPRTGDISIGGGGSNGGTDPLPEEEDPSKILAGIFYTVNAYPSWASFNFTPAGKYFIPRSGSIRFFGQNETSEEIEVHGERGWVVNPNPRQFRLADWSGYRPEFLGSLRPLYVDARMSSEIGLTFN